MKHLVTGLALLIATSAVQAVNLPTASPEDVGMSSERLTQISRWTQDYVDKERHTGFVTLVARRGKIVHFEATGTMGINDNRPVKKDTLFRIFSMTKPITAVAAMMLYEEGAFQLSDPIAQYLPELSNLQVRNSDGTLSPANPIIVEQLFTHTAGLSYGFHGDELDAEYRKAMLSASQGSDDFLQRLATLPLRYQPGTRYHYSVATDVLGVLVERLSGMSLDQFFRERIFNPLEMNDTFFNVPKDKLSRLATMHSWDYNSQSLSLELPGRIKPNGTKPTFFSGGGGLYSTAEDYLVFTEMLRNGGSIGQVRILGPKTVQYMVMNHLTEEVRNRDSDKFPSSHLYPGQSFGLGLGVITEPGLSQVVSSKGEFSWGGAADTKFWVDPEEDLSVVVMTQLLNSPWPTRYQMKAAVYQALTELGSK